MKGNRELRQRDQISPFLFVIIIEFLYRKLVDLNMIPNFNYHGNCEKCQIVDISFVDDLLLFTRGDVTPIQLVMDRFHSFSKSTTLYANPEKCKLYIGGMDNNTKKQIAEITGFAAGILPFSYLGIRLTSKKLTKVNALVWWIRLGLVLNCGVHNW